MPASAGGSLALEMIEIQLDRLHAHPANSNVMPPALLDKLVAHLRDADRYPPVIVRPLPGGTGREVGGGGDYQILDGHHRVAALRRLERPAARCVVWEVDDREALLLLATLNRLQGQDDPRKRGALVARLSGSMDFSALAGRLPEDAYRLKKLAALTARRPPPRPPRPMAAMPVALHFFLLPAQRSAVERRLREVGGSRESALLSLLDVETPPADPTPEGPSAKREGVADDRA